MATSPPKQSFSREEVRRALDVSERQLRTWERQGLIDSSETFAFKDLVALRALSSLWRSKVPRPRIREAIAAVRSKLGEVVNPLTDLRVFADGKRIGVQVAGRKMEPITGQLLFDFDAAELKRLLSFPKAQPGKERHRKHEAERWFQRGLDLEQSGADTEEVVAAYKHAIENDPHSAGALVNLGTVHFNSRAFKEAEGCYKRALEVDPNYPLAHFNLGNLYDEKGDRRRALAHYLAALELNPQYADAHYNIALLYQMSGQTLRAVRHWRVYLKLDPSSSWAVIARRELDKLRAATIVRGRE
ncbi:MAG: tetratricopeptide repeat protein [Bryobacteraceae bacterium]|nr:tetratricopeptide repeat protein [Bryobacteraceae bacterium]